MSEQLSEEKSDWRQGDFVLAPFQLPGLASADGKLKISNYPADHGIVLLSQSCDIENDDVEVVQIAPLAKADPDEMEEIKKRRRSRQAFIPQLESAGLVANLDHCTVITKTALAAYSIERGCPCDKSQATLSRTMGRHRGRYAFPTPFIEEVASKIRSWVKGKKGANSETGRMVEAIVEVRVHSDDIDSSGPVTIYFLFDGPVPSVLPKEWTTAKETLEKRVKDSQSYPAVEVLFASLDDISGGEYRRMIELDWDGISPTAAELAELPAAARSNLKAASGAC